MLSNTCKYGIRAVIYLAVNQIEGKKIGIKKISEELTLPAPFLGKILQMLAKKKMLASTKGPNGGFSLAKDAEDITLFDIVEAIDGTDVFEQCMIGLKICEDDKSKEEKCPFHEKSSVVRTKFYNAFKQQTVKDFSTGIKNADEILTF